MLVSSICHFLGGKKGGSGKVECVRLKERGGERERGYNVLGVFFVAAKAVIRICHCNGVSVYVTYETT